MLCPAQSAEHLDRRWRSIVKIPMLMLLRHLLSIVVLPFVVVVLVPAWLLNTIWPAGVPWADASFLVEVLRAIGLALFIAGLG